MTRPLRRKPSAWLSDVDLHLFFEFTQADLLVLSFSIKSHKIAWTYLRRVLLRCWAVAEIDLDWGWHVALSFYRLGRWYHGRERGVEILSLIGHLPAATFKVVIPGYHRLGHSSLLKLDAPLCLYALAVSMRISLSTCTLLFERHSLRVIAGKVILHVVNAPGSPRLLSRGADILPKRPFTAALDRQLFLSRCVVCRLIYKFQALLLGEEVLLRCFIIPKAVALAVLCRDCHFFPGEPSRHGLLLKFTILFIINQWLSAWISME